MMAMSTPIVFKLKELAELLVKHQGIHEGHWGIFVRFALSATNIGDASNANEMYPTAIVPVTELGIQQFDEPNPLTVDAAVVNPTK